MYDDAQLIKIFYENRDRDEKNLKPQVEEARTNHGFVAGDKMYMQGSIKQRGRVKELVTFNKVKPYIDGVAGLMIQTRRKAKYEARIKDNQAQQAYSDFTNNFSDYLRENGNFDHIESWADREMLIAGYAAVDVSVTYDDNPDGDVDMQPLRFDEVSWDSESRSPNLIDARHCCRTKALHKDDVKFLFPEFSVEDFDAYVTNEYNAGYDDSSMKYGVVREDPNLLRVFKYQWWELQNYWRAENPAREMQDPEMRRQFIAGLQFASQRRYEMAEKAGKEKVEDLFQINPFAEYLNMTNEQKKDVEELADMFGVEFKAIKQPRKCYYTAMITGKTILDKFKSLDQSGFTIKFKTGNYDPNNRIWYGMVRGMREPALYASKALTEILYTIAHNSKGGVMYEESAVVNVQKFEQDYASTDSAIMVADGAISGNKIKDKAQPKLPNGYEEVYQAADAAISETSGLSKEFLGTSSAVQVSALLESQRINQVMSGLAQYFDSITLFQTELARLMLTYMRVLAENGSGRLLRIVGENGLAQYKELSVDMFADEYDVVVSEGLVTPAQKQQTMEVMLGLADKLAVMGQNIYPIVIDYLPIPNSDKQRIAEQLKPDPQAAAQQAEAAAQAAQRQAEVDAVMIEATRARIMKDTADAMRKQAEIPKVAAEIDNVQADTAQTLEEAAKVAAENEVVRSAPIQDVRVVV